MSSSRHDIMREEIPHCALMRRSGGCHFGHFGGGHGDPPPATQCWMLGWGGSRTPIKYYGGFPPPSGLEVIVGREPNHQQCWKSLWGGSRTTSNLDVELSALPRPPQPPRGGNATARRGPTHMPPRIGREPNHQQCWKSGIRLCHAPPSPPEGGMPPHAVGPRTSPTLYLAVAVWMSQKQNPTQHNGAYYFWQPKQYTHYVK